MKVIPDTHHTH